MKSWKVLLGVGGACAACCALPIAATVTALFAGAGGGLAVYGGSVLPVVGVAAAAGLAGAGIWWRRRAAKGAACGCAPSAPTAAPGGCNAGSCT